MRAGVVAARWQSGRDEDRGSSLRIDPYSTGAHFPGWAERATFRYRIVAVEAVLPSPPPASWLLREGWKLGNPISVYERPGQGPKS